MSWAVGFDPNWKRDVGYGVPATCDHPGCGAKIDRGLSYICGGDVFGGDEGCGLYFCAKHLAYTHDLGTGTWTPQLCECCIEGKQPFKPTPDVKQWTQHKAKHPSWAEWRAEQKETQA